MQPPRPGVSPDHRGFRFLTGAVSMVAMMAMASDLGLPGTARAGSRGASDRIVFRSTRDGNQEIYIMNPDGSGQTRLTTSPSRDEFSPALSPDGSRIAYAVKRGALDTAEIFVMNDDGTGRVRLSSNAWQDDYPAWSADGTRIAFVSKSDGDYEIYAMTAAGKHVRNLTNAHASQDQDPAWSPDGTQIAFVSDRPGATGPTDIFVMDVDGSNLVDVTNSPGTDWAPEWSPDGTKIAFRNDRTGDYDIYVMNADGSRQVDITNDPALDRQPTWSPDGTMLAFATDRDGNYEVYVMGADGSAPEDISNHPALDNMPDWGL